MHSIEPQCTREEADRRVEVRQPGQTLSNMKAAPEKLLQSVLYWTLLWAGLSICCASALPTSNAASIVKSINQFQPKWANRETVPEPTPQTNPQPNHLTAGATNFFAGGAGGACSVIVGYPFDLTKTTLQTTQSKSNMWRVMTGIVKQNGIRGLYRGVSIQLFGVAPICALNFSGYKIGQQLYAQALGIEGEEGKRPRLDQCAFGAALAVLPSSLIVIPGDRIKVFMQVGEIPNRSVAQMSATQVITHLYREGGVRELYRGATISLMREAVCTVSFFVSYEIFKHQFCQSDVSVKDLGGFMLAGGLAGISCWLTCLPLDNIKSLIQTAGRDSVLFTTRSPIKVAAMHIWGEAGVMGLYRGLLPVLVRAFPANSACIIGYEASKLLIENLFQEKSCQ